MTTSSIFARSPLRAIAVATVLAAALAGCAVGANPPDGSGGSMPGGIDYHGGPYRMQNG